MLDTVASYYHVMNTDTSLELQCINKICIITSINVNTTV